MWSGNSAFQLLIITAGGKFTGLFVYSGNAPANGNLVASITAQAGTDPFGNHFDAGITSYDNAFGGVTEISGALIQLFAGTNLLQKINPSGYVIYSPTAAAGNQVASMAPAGFTDAYGNAISAGVTSYLPGTARATLFQAGLVLALLGAPPSVTNGVLQIARQSAGQSVQISSGAIGAHVNSLLLLNDSAASGAVGAGSGLHVVDGIDGNTYDTERLSLFLAADAPVAISTNVVLFSKAVGTGNYAIDGIIKGVQGAAAVGQGVQFAGPAVSFNDIYIESNAVGNTSVTDSDLTGALPVAHLTPAWGAGVTFYIRFRGFLTFSAAGTFTVVGQGSAGGAWTAKAASLFSLYPVSAA